MLGTGSYIKLQRVQQGMTQDELAKVIVSMSYLSKIENERAEASPEVVRLLCTRLGIEMTNNTDMTIKDKCEEWYGMLFENHDKQDIKSRYHELNDLLEKVNSNESIMFAIHKVRYFLIMGELEIALEQINHLNEIANTFDNLHLYYWYKFKGNYKTIHGDNNLALKMYELAEEKLKQLNLGDGEADDLYYTIAVTHSKIRNTLEAIDYANRAINTFRIEYHFTRCAQCHIVLGISYRRIKMYDKAIKNYNLAKHLGELEKNNQIIQLTNVNLGYLHSAKGDSLASINYYAEVAKDEEVNLNTRLTSITSLIKEYYSIGDIEQTQLMIEEAFSLLEEKIHDDAYKIHYYVLNTYKFAVHKEHQMFEKMVIKEFIPYLKEHKDYANLVVIANMLAKHFEDVSKYKEAVKYYKLANSTYENLVSI